jgi:hypothetical protein
MHVTKPLDRRMKGEDLPLASPTAQLKILPSMTIKILRAKVLRALKLSPSLVQIRLWVLLFQGTTNSLVTATEIDPVEDSNKEISSLGLDDDDGVAVLVVQST